MNKKNQILYAPWRKQYLKSDLKKQSKNPKTCVFCKISEDEIIFQTKRVYLIANKYPYSEGHLLVIPKRHVNQFVQLTSKEREDLFNLLALSMHALELALKPQGFNIGCSIGEVAGESINHLHFHILSRYKGDVSWSKLCYFDVISFSPQELSEKIKEIIVKQRLSKKFNL